MAEEVQLLLCRIGTQARAWTVALPLSHVRYVFPAEKLGSLPRQPWPGVPDAGVQARWGIVVNRPSPSWLAALHVEAPRAYPLTAVRPVPRLLDAWQARFAAIAFVLTDEGIVPVIDLTRQVDTPDTSLPGKR